MAGETNLDMLLSSLTAELVDGLFVFATVKDGNIPEQLTPRMVFKEAEGTTLIVLKSDAEKCALNYEFPCRMITLSVHSALEAVGFIAHISAALSKHGISVNPVSGFFHDHLFVPAGQENAALDVLRQIRMNGIC